MEWYKQHADEYNRKRRDKYAHDRLAKEGVTVKTIGPKPRRKPEIPSTPTTPINPSTAQQVAPTREVIPTATQEELERLRTQVAQLTQAHDETKRNETKLQQDLTTTRQQLNTSLANEITKEETIKTKNKLISELEQKLINERLTKEEDLKSKDKLLSETEAKLNETITRLTTDKEQLTKQLEEEKKGREADKIKYKGQISEIVELNRQATEAYNVATQHIQTKDQEISELKRQRDTPQIIVSLPPAPNPTITTTPLPTPIVSSLPPTPIITNPSPQASPSATTAPIIVSREGDGIRKYIIKNREYLEWANNNRKQRTEVYLALGLENIGTVQNEFKHAIRELKINWAVDGRAKAKKT